MGTVYACQLTSDIDVYSLSMEAHGKIVWKEIRRTDADQVQQEYRRMFQGRAGYVSRFHKNLKIVTTGCIHKWILCMWSSFPSARGECPLDPNV